MSDSTRLTDQQITEMLRERVRQPVPEDLRDIVLDEVRSVRRLPRSRRVGGRSRVGLLLVAAVLVVASSLVATSAGALRFPTRPSPSAPAVVAPATTTRPTPSRSAGQTTRPASIPCPAFDEIARRGGAGTGADPVPGAPSHPVAAGDVIVLGSATVSPNEADDPMVFDPFGSPPAPVSISPWNLSSAYIDRWAPSADGTVVATELGGTCDDVFVMRSDGSGLRTPFTALHHSSFGPAWAPDGSFLAVASVPPPPHVPTIEPLPSFDPAASTLLIWSPTSDSVTDLGRPCETCSPVGWAPRQGIAGWSPDSQRIAVDYTDLSCGVANPEPSLPAGCRGIAIVTAGGDWQRIPIQADGRESQVRLLAWADDQTLIVTNGPDFALLTVEDGVLRRLPAKVPDSLGMWDVDQEISPDRTKAITGGGFDGPHMEVTDLRSGKSTRLGPLPPDWLDLTWSPDSKWILIQADTDGYGANRGLYLVRIDGSQPVRRVLPGGFGPMAWMAAAS